MLIELIKHELAEVSAVCFFKILLDAFDAETSAV